jgi:hypothetical protein
MMWGLSLCGGDSPLLVEGMHETRPSRYFEATEAMNLRGMPVWDLCFCDEKGDQVDMGVEPLSVLPAQFHRRSRRQRHLPRHRPSARKFMLF